MSNSTTFIDGTGTDKYCLCFNDTHDKDLSDVIGDKDINKIYKLTIIGGLKDKNDLLSKCINMKQMDLEICHPDWIKIPETLINLERLDIYSSFIDNIPNTLTKLKSLSLICCDFIYTIPNTFINLEELTIKRCDKIKEIPETLTNLKELCIRGCNNIIIPNNIRNIPNIKIEQI